MFFAEKPSPFRHYLGFDWSGWIVLINSQILIMTGRVWPVSSDKWKASAEVSALERDGPLIESQMKGVKKGRYISNFKIFFL